MTRLFRLVFCLLVFACLVLAPALAQSQSVASGTKIRPVTLIARESGHQRVPAQSSADTLSVVVFKAIQSGSGYQKDGPPINPAEDHIFKSGEFIIVSFTPTFEGYVYLLSRDSEGTRVIFPPTVSNIRPIMPGEPRNPVLKLDDKVGSDEIIVVVSRDRLTKLDEAIARPDKKLDIKISPPTEATSAATGNKNAGISGHSGHKSSTQSGKNHRGGKKTYRVPDSSGLIAANPRLGVLEDISSSGSGVFSSRGVDFVQEEGNPSVQVRPVRDDKGSYRFGPGQVGAFSFSFEHR